jgi:hypothetical protein
MKHLIGEERGFALVVVIFALVMMSTVAVASLVLADDERRASRALRAGNASFYAAEAGLNEVWATRFGQAFADSLQKGLINIPPGGSLDLGWKDLGNGARYNGRLWRYDNGGQRIYGLVAEGRGGRSLSGQQRVAFGMTTRYGSGGMKLGKCCDAAGTVRGDVYMEGTSTLTGMDGTPPSGWPASRCTDVPPVNKPGIITKDNPSIVSVVEVKSPATLTGNPPRKQDTSIDDATFTQYGDITFDQLKAMANHTILGGSVTPAPATKLVNGTLTCDTSKPNNWGSPDPSHVCYNYFPIIVLRGETDGKITALNGYGQGMLLLDKIGATGKGTELDFEGAAGSVFAGLILGWSCVEIQGGHHVYGAAFGDKNTANASCDGDKSLNFKESGKLQWSSCVVQRVLEQTGVGAASGGVLVAGMRKLSRGFGTVLR